MSELRMEGTEMDRVREMEAAVARRLQAAERENERLRRRMGLLLAASGVAALAAVAALVVALGAAPGLSGGTVEARELVLRDAAGEVRARLGTTADGAARMVLVDRDGRARMRLSLLADGSPGITFADRAGRPRVVLGLLPDQSANLVMADGAGRTRAVLGYSADDAVTLLFADAGVCSASTVCSRTLPRPIGRSTIWNTRRPPTS